jgi:hypothetical protein
MTRMPFFHLSLHPEAVSPPKKKRSHASSCFLPLRPQPYPFPSPHRCQTTKKNPRPNSVVSRTPPRVPTPSSSGAPCTAPPPPTAAALPGLRPSLAGYLTLAHSCSTDLSRSSSPRRPNPRRVPRCLHPPTPARRALCSSAAPLAAISSAGTSSS